MRFGRTLALSAMVLMSLCLSARADLLADLQLNNTTWNVKLTPDQASERLGAKAFDETFIFVNNEMIAEAFSKYGFFPSSAGGSFTDVLNGVPTAYSFTINMNSGKHGTLRWQGKLKNGRSTGTMTWTRRDGTVWVFAFEADKAREESLDNSGSGSDSSGSGN